MRIVMSFDRSRRSHFRKKLSFQYLERSAVCKAEKRFRSPKTARKRFCSRTLSKSLPTDWEPLLLGAGVPPFRQARFRNFRNGRLVIVRGVIKEGQARACWISKIDNIQGRRFLVEIIAVSPRIESDQRAE